MYGKGIQLTSNESLGSARVVKWSLVDLPKELELSIGFPYLLSVSSSKNELCSPPEFACCFHTTSLDLFPRNKRFPSVPAPVCEKNNIMFLKTLQELRMLSSVTVTPHCQIRMIVINSGYQLSEMTTLSHKFTSHVKSLT